jgi:polygalacturonase
MSAIKGIIGLMLFLLLLNGEQTNSEDKWKEIYTVMGQMEEPSFPTKEFKITDFGAVGDGKTMNTVAINTAIETCSREGGGQVIIAGGEFLTGAVHLKTNVNLVITEGATLKFSRDPKDYLMLVQTRWEGNDCFNYSPLIYANGQTNIAITGKGTIDGQANQEYWWPWKGFGRRNNGERQPSQLDPEGRPLLTKWDNTKTPLVERRMGEGHYMRPQLINFIYCQRVKIENVTLLNSPFWVIHPLLSENIIVRNVNINSHGPNSDGCDPESCKNVLIENCTFNTGDDCIALKSGRNFDGRRSNVPIENVLIRNCKMKDGHGGVVMGSEISAGCKNIFAENCEMNSPNLERVIRIKTNNNRGGISDGIYIRNLTVGQVREAIVKINCSYDPREGQGEFMPMVKNVYISNVTSEKSRYGLSLTGIKGENCVENISVNNCKFSGVEQGNRVQYVKNLNLKDLHINGEKVDQIPSEN